MKKNLLLIVMAVAGCMVISSCVSKKALENCQWLQQCFERYGRGLFF